MKPRILAPLFVACSLTGAAGMVPQNAQCTRVADGDTLKIGISGQAHTVRFTGMDGGRRPTEPAQADSLKGAPV